MYEMGTSCSFFKHKNQSSPSSLTSKSDLLVYFQSSKPNQEVLADAPLVDADILDGAAAVVHMLPLIGVKTYDDGYAVTIFMAYILKMFEKLEKIVIVWDKYLPMSL